jgi:hypothetical protein
LLLVGTVAFALPAIGVPWAPEQPSTLSIVEGGAGYVPHIACDPTPCDCPDC